MNIHLTLGPKFSEDKTDIQGIEEKDDSIIVHWKAYPGGAHVYTDISKNLLIDWYETYAGGSVSGDFEKLLSEFNRILPSTVKRDSDTYNYLLKNYETADDEWENNTLGLFSESQYPDIYTGSDYRGTNSQYEKTSYTAMQAWLMAMCLAELVPNSGFSSNRQTELYQKAYTLGGGRKIPLYGGYTIKGNPMNARLVAGAIWAKNRAGYTYSQIDSMRDEVGGSTISLEDWKALGYSTSSNVGYNIATNDIFPSAPGPFMSSQSSRSYPSEQPSDLFDTAGDFWCIKNYKVDVEIDKFITDHYNLSAKDDYLARTVQAVVDDSENTKTRLGEKTYYEYDPTAQTPVQGQIVPGPRFTFKPGTPQSTGNAGYFEGTFSSSVTGIDLSSKITDSSGNDTALKTFMDGVRDAGGNTRKQLYDIQAGRMRPANGTDPGTARVKEGSNYKMNWLDDKSIENLRGSGTKEYSDGSTRSWYIDLNGNGKWDDGEPKYNDSTEATSDLYPKPETYTYPSGHSAGVFSSALAMMQMLIQKSPSNTEVCAKLFKAAYNYSVSRTIVRAHWNSDIIYGRVIGTMILPVLNAITQFRTSYQTAYNMIDGGSFDDETRLKNMYAECIKTNPDESKAFDHHNADSASNIITFKIYNAGSQRIFYNGRFLFFTTDDTPYIAHYKEPSSLENGSHWYYCEESNYILEPKETLTIEAPIQRKYPNQTIDTSKRLETNASKNGYMLYCSSNSTDDNDSFLHNTELSCINTDSLVTKNASGMAVSENDRTKITAGWTYELTIRGDKTVSYVLPTTKDKTVPKTYLRHVRDNGEIVLVPMRLSDWSGDTPTPPTPTPSYWDTGLPVVMINTGGREIPSPDGEWLTGVSIQIYQNSSTVLYESTALQLRGRGNSSWKYSKKPLALKLEAKTEILGMAKSKRWCLLANYEDRTLMRNEMAFSIAQCTDLSTGMGWSPKGKFVELVLDGVHKGSYYLSEQVRVESSRVNIDEYSDYLLEYDRYSESEEFYFYSGYKNFPITVKSPDSPTIPTISGYINAVETAIYNDNNFSVLNLNSFADYWIVEELTGNIETADAKPGSVYLQYVTGIEGQSDKVVMGPVWDFDYSTFLRYAPIFAGKDTSSLNYKNKTASGTYSDPESVIPANGYMPNTFINKNSVYFDKLFESAQFKAIVKQRWNNYKPSLIALIDKFDTVASQIQESVALDDTLWGVPRRELTGDYWPDKSMTFSDAVASAKQAYREKLNFLDEKINSW